MTTVMLIEDDPDILLLLREVLAMEGIETVGVSDIAGIRTIAGALRPDVFLIDLMLPHTTGIEMARHLRRDGFYHTPMVAMSASHILLETARQSDLFQDIIAKPLEIDDLISSIQRLAPNTS